MRHLQSYRYVDAIARIGSIRGAAETLAITPSALNRRVLALEDELGVAIFERMAHGVRLSAAGELMIHHIRNQLSDIERVKSQIADLSGMRRGHVSIACSQALLPFFLPEQIATYRREHPNVTFGVHLRDRAAAEQALADHSADIALVFEPVRMSDFQTLTTVRQPIHAVMSAAHPLAQNASLRLRECLRYPIALPATAYGVRYLLDASIARNSLKILEIRPAVESDSFEFLRRYVMSEDLITFQIPIGLPPSTAGADLTSIPINSRDVPDGLLYMGQLRGRILPVATARFAGEVTKVLDYRYN